MIGESISQHSVTNKLVRNRMTRRKWIRTPSLMIGIILVVLSCDKKESSSTGPGNTAPELSSIGNQVAQAGQTSKVILTTRDEDGDALNFDIPTNPGFLSISSFSLFPSLQFQHLLYENIFPFINTFPLISNQ